MDIYNKFRTHYEPVLVHPNGQIVQPGDRFTVTMHSHESVVEYVQPSARSQSGNFDDYFNYNRFEFREAHGPGYLRYGLKPEQLGLRFARIPVRRHSPWRSSALTQGTKQRIRHPYRHSFQNTKNRYSK